MQPQLLMRALTHAAEKMYKRSGPSVRLCKRSGPSMRLYKRSGPSVRNTPGPRAVEAGPARAIEPYRAGRPGRARRDLDSAETQIVGRAVRARDSDSARVGRQHRLLLVRV